MSIEDVFEQITSDPATHNQTKIWLRVWKDIMEQISDSVQVKTINQLKTPIETIVNTNTSRIIRIQMESTAFYFSDPFRAR